MLGEADFELGIGSKGILLPCFFLGLSLNWEL